MVKKVLIAIIVLVSAAATKDVPVEQEAGFGSSCVMHVKSAVYPSDPMDPRGKARIYVTLTSKDGEPISGQQIQLTTTCGTFSCKPLDSEDTSVVDSSIYECDHTDKNGKIMVYVVNIPFNNQGSVTAECEYGSLSVKASCIFLISRHEITKKARAKPQQSSTK